jgi:hypothetical protein
MDGSRFDGLTRGLIARPGTRRLLAVALVAGFLGRTVEAPMAHEASAAGRCHKGDHKCHGKCCPSRGPVCCKHGCCKKGFKCCNGGRACCG